MWQSWLFDVVYLYICILSQKHCNMAIFWALSLNYWGLTQHLALNVPNSVERKYVLGQSPFRLLTLLCTVVLSFAFPIPVFFCHILKCCIQRRNEFFLPRKIAGRRGCYRCGLWSGDSLCVSPNTDLRTYYVRYCILEWHISILLI